MNWASQLSPHHRLIFPLRVPASPLRCLLFHRDEMRHYWLIRRDKENYLMHIQKINRNKAWYDTLKGKLFPQHIIKWDSADFFSIYVFISGECFQTIFSTSTQQIIFWDDRCMIIFAIYFIYVSIQPFSSCILTAFKFQTIKKIKKYRNMRNPTPC